MGKQHVKLKEAESRNYISRYLRYNDWGFSTPVRTSEWSITADPLPEPPQHVLEDPDVTSTLASHPHLFKIVTPVKTHHLRSLTMTHPNQPFVHSVLRGLEHGFWPWATYPEDHPSTYETQCPPPSTNEQREFLLAQRDIEISKDRYSQAFAKLLPGMRNTPTFAVPKDGGNELRMVTNHSKEPYSQNSMVDKVAMGKVPLDGMKVLG
ncbi:hypothetical protein DFP72DRAFT_831055, partial [Ephemerocybe angulata]